MKIKYDKESDIIYIKISDASISESIENKPGVIIDYDQSSKIVGIEILQASQNM
ncbi:MAG: DUF2283 domain-containing protein [Bacteroidetes bacterium]|jgi:uncharacterized protein YuzE|nr:DUF2283 domain-containing protein [Bacteroidota bacterium]